MGMEVFMTLEREEKNLDLENVTGFRIFTEQEFLDQAAIKAGVRPLSDFMSMDMEECGDLIPGGLEGFDELPPAEWFDPNEGLLTIQALINAIPAGDAETEQGLLREELESFRSVLQAAVKSGNRFRYAVSM